MAKRRITITEQDVAAVLEQGTWKASEVAAMLDTPLAVVVRWCQVGVIRGAFYSAGAWRIPGRALFLFLARRVECHYSVATVAAMLDKPEDTIRTWIQQKRLPVVKLGLARQASAVVPESALIKFLKAEREPGKKTDSKAEGRAA
jgi:hypothetical protein